MVTIMYIPMLNLFLSMLYCKSRNGEFYLNGHSDVQCWQGEHIIYSVAAIVSCLVFVPLCYIAGATYYESD